MGLTKEHVFFLVKLLGALKRENGGVVEDVVVGDERFVRVLAGEVGAFALPLIGVAYNGTPKAGSVDTGGITHKAQKTFSIIAITENKAGVDSELVADDEGLYDLIDDIFDVLTGKIPVRTIENAAGALVFLDGDEGEVDDDEDGNRIGDSFEYVADDFVDLPEAAVQAGLVAWSISFANTVFMRPDRPEITAPPEIAGFEVGFVPAGDDIEIPVEPDATPLEGVGLVVDLDDET